MVIFFKKNIKKLCLSHDRVLIPGPYAYKAHALPTELPWHLALIRAFVLLVGWLNQFILLKPTIWNDTSENCYQKKHTKICIFQSESLRPPINGLYLDPIYHRIPAQNWTLYQTTN